MKMKNLTVRLTPEERDILHSALLNCRLFIERQLDDKDNARYPDLIKFYLNQLVGIKAQAKKLKLEGV